MIYWDNPERDVVWDNTAKMIGIAALILLANIGAYYFFKFALKIEHAKIGKTFKYYITGVSTGASFRYSEATYKTKKLEFTFAYAASCLVLNVLSAMVYDIAHHHLRDFHSTELEKALDNTYYCQKVEKTDVDDVN